MGPASKHRERESQEEEKEEEKRDGKRKNAREIKKRHTFQVPVLDSLTDESESCLIAWQMRE